MTSLKQFKSSLVCYVSFLETGSLLSFLCWLFLSAYVAHLVTERPEFTNIFFLLDLNSEENEIFKEI